MSIFKVWEYNILKRESVLIMRLETISAKEIDFYINNKNYIIIDLRDRDEFLSAHIKGAVNIEYDSILTRIQSLSKDKNIILYCDRGGMSIMAAKSLTRMGYNVKSVVGGINAYTGKNIVIH